MQPDDPNKLSGPKEQIKEIRKEAAVLGLIFSFLASEVTFSSLIVFLRRAMNPNLGIDEISAIWNVFVATVPLTIAIAIIFLLFYKQKLPFAYGSYGVCALVLWGAAVMGDQLQLGIRRINPESLDFRAFHHPFARVLSEYFTAYGAVLMAKSSTLGIFFGRWFTKLFPDV